MAVTIDMTKFKGPMSLLKERARNLPKVLVKEAGIVVERVMKYHAPYLTGALKSSIFPEWHGNRILVTPHVYYAIYTQKRGKSRGWVERTYAASFPLLTPALNVKAKLYIEEGY